MKRYRPVMLLLLIVVIAIGAFAVYWVNRPHSVLLKWDASPDATSYNVYRKQIGQEYMRVGSSLTTSYVDKPVVNGAVYFYAVKAVRDGKESVFSNEIRVEIP